MAFLPDVLDAMGKTPRELGRYHLHVEPVTRLPNGRCGARLWLQAAFATTGEQALLSVDSSAGPVLPSPLPVPKVEGASVVLWELPLHVGPEVTELRFALDSKVPASATRLRQAWKLLDTWESPKLSEMEPVASTSSVNVGASLLGTALLGGSGFFLSWKRTPSLAANDKVTVHKAPEQPSFFVAPVVAQQAEIAAEPRVSVFWREGEPIPEPPPLVVAPRPRLQPYAGLRRCAACGFEGPSQELERTRACPQCDAPW